jgi:1-acyl-sn-glycerol-3-phosphate acyltransferase
VVLPSLARRVLAPVLVVAELGFLVLFAATTVVGLVVAPFDGRRRILRIGAMGVAYLSVELLALAALCAVWVCRRAYPPSWWEDVNRRILRWALGGVLGAARRCFGFVVAVDDRPPSSALLDSPPVLVLARHGGLGDSYALVWLLLGRYERRVRVVLKDVLQWEPLLDVSLNRLGACFLPKQPPDGEELAQRLATLALDLGPRDALLLFPEGRNWTIGRRARAIQRLHAERKHSAAKAAALMEHVLPPRPAGVFACLDARPDLAVVVVAHTGLDTLTTVARTWNAIPFQQAMIVRWWPTPTPPSEPEARLAWLTTEWAVVDEWIDARKADDAARIEFLPPTFS